MIETILQGPPGSYREHPGFIPSLELRSGGTTLPVVPPAHPDQLHLVLPPRNFSGSRCTEENRMERKGPLYMRGGGP